jgi:glucose uptake protein GlcU
MALPGSAAGITWCLGNVLLTVANVSGGGAITGAIATTSALTTSGLWGILYYREMRGRAALRWAGWALVMAVMTTLLALEKK